MQSYNFTLSFIAIAALAGLVVAQPLSNDSLMMSKKQPVLEPGTGRKGDYTAKAKETKTEKTSKLEEQYRSEIPTEPMPEISKPNTSEPMPAELDASESAPTGTDVPNYIVEVPKKSSKPDKNSNNSYESNETSTSESTSDGSYNSEPIASEPIEEFYNPEATINEPTESPHIKSKHHSKNSGRFNKHYRSKKIHKHLIGAYKPSFIKSKPKKKAPEESKDEDISYELEDIDEKLEKSKQNKKDKKSLKIPGGYHKHTSSKKKPSIQEPVVDEPYNPDSSETDSYNPDPVESKMKSKKAKNYKPSYGTDNKSKENLSTPEVNEEEPKVESANPKNSEDYHSIN